MLNLSLLTSAEAHWIDYVKNAVVGRLPGSPEERARTAAIVTWWALKEGVLDVAPNPWRHSLCHFPGAGGGDRKIGDLDTCPGNIWQVGMAGVQVNAATDAQVESIASQLYPGQTLPEILAGVAQDAGLDEATALAVAQSDGLLRRSWLLRDPAIAFVVQRPFVERQCISGNVSWCYGSWDTARAFASSPARVQEVVGALEDYFQGAPGPGPRPGDGSKGAFPWLFALALGGAATYWYYRAGGKKLLA